MGQKTFTDWNGPKRKLLVRPKDKKERDHRVSQRKNPGFKTLVDRYRAILLNLSRDWVWRKHDLRNYLKWKEEGAKKERGCEPIFIYRFKRGKEGLWSMKRAKKMKAELIVQGLYKKVLDSIGSWKFRERYKHPWK